jgi:hypothetical protein
MIFTRRASGIFAPDNEPIIVDAPIMRLGANVRARLCRPKSGTVIKEWQFHNRLVNAYLDPLGTYTGGYPGNGLDIDTSNYFAAGTGVTVPAATDTALVAEITAGGRGTTTLTAATYVAGTPDYCIYTRRATFSTAQANGTIGEFIWISTSSGAGTARARAVPKDTTGTQTTITKTSASTLILDWTIKIFMLQTDLVVTRNISGVPYTVTVRAIDCNTTTPGPYFIVSRGPTWNDLSARTQSALVSRTTSATSGTAIGSSGASAYVSGTYTRDVTYNSIAGMSAMAFWAGTGGNTSDQYVSVQAGFSPAISLANQQIKFRLSWAPF